LELIKELYYDAQSNKSQAVQHVTVLNTVGNCNTMVSIIILYYTYLLHGAEFFLSH